MGIFDILFRVQEHLKELSQFHNSVYVSIYGDNEIGEISQNYGSVLIVPLTENVEPGPKGCKDKVRLQFAIAVSVYHADDHSKMSTAIKEVGVLGTLIVEHMRNFICYEGVQGVARQSSLNLEGLNGWVLYPLVYEARMVL